MTAMNPWILLVDADSRMCETILMPGLEHAGFKVIGAGTAAEAYRCMTGRMFSIFVLGSNLPDADVPTLARCLRSVTDAAIVVMSEKNPGVFTKRVVLSENADVYLDKPIDIKHMVRTLRSLSRRLKPTGKSTIASRPTAGWRLETSGWDLVSPEGSKINLNHSERLLMKKLASSSGKTVKRDTIVSLLSPRTEGFDHHRLEMLIYRLRRKVSVVTREPLPLKNVRGVGYAFIA